MTNPKLKIVIFTGSNPFRNSGIMSYDMFKSFKNEGHTVLLLTRQFDSRFESGIKSIYGKKATLVDEFIRKVKNKLDLRRKDSEYCMQSLDESGNYISTKRILKKIPFTPDVFIYLFPHRFLNAKNLFEFNQVTGATICIYPADMAQFTGGCHYVNNCVGFKHNCGSCPGLFSKNENDITYKNWKFKHKYISLTNKLFTLTNTWTADFIKQSSIFFGKPNYLINDIINETEFCPGDKSKARKLFGIPQENKVIFFGATAVQEKRKGLDYLVNSIKLLYENVNDQLKTEIVIAIAGKSHTDISHLFPFKVYTLGHLNHKQLVDAYRMTDIFASPSIQDTGPMMVLQSLMCGTPVVSFEMGNSIDYIINYQTGFRAPLYDTEKFKDGLLFFLTRTNSEKEIISKECRDIAVQKASYKSFEKDFIEAFNDFNLNKL